MKPLFFNWIILKNHLYNTFLLYFFCLSGDDDEDEDDELLKRTGNYVAASDALPKGIIKVCV